MKEQQQHQNDGIAGLGFQSTAHLSSFITYFSHSIATPQLLKAHSNPSFASHFPHEDPDTSLTVRAAFQQKKVMFYFKVLYLLTGTRNACVELVVKNSTTNTVVLTTFTTIRIYSEMNVQSSDPRLGKRLTYTHLAS